MKRIHPILITFLLLSLICCGQDSKEQTTKKLYSVDKCCEAIFLEGELRYIIDFVSPLDPIKDKVKVDSLVDVIDSIYEKFGRIDTTHHGWGNYSKNYRENCLKCWTDSLEVGFDSFEIIYKGLVHKEQIHPVHVYNNWHFLNDKSFESFTPSSMFFIDMFQKYVNQGILKNQDLMIETNLNEIKIVNQYLVPIIRKEVQQYDQSDVLLLFSLFEYFKEKEE